MTQSLQDYWRLVVDVWRQGVGGISIGEIVMALVAVIAGIALRHFFARFALARLKAYARRSKTQFDDVVLNALERPLAFIPVLIGIFAATQILPLSGDAQMMSARLNRSLVAFTLFWALYAITDPIADALLQSGRLFTQELVSWLARLTKVAFIGIGAAAVLEIWGIEVGPLLAGLGLFGVAVALGAQDLFKNLIAGMFIIGEQRFRIGDWIFVDGIVEGTVERIGFRTTTVRRFDKAEVYVPNAKLSDSAVTNFTRMTYRRIFWTIGVVYDTSIDQLRAIRDRIEAYVTGNEDFAAPSEAATFVRIDKFSDSAIDIMLYCFTRTTVWGEWLAVKEKLALAIKDIVEGEGSSFAFPSRSLYVETLPPADRPEPFPLGPSTPADTAKP
ncbi:MAG: mechanosensitive ion channel family protein [Alphaproteobacteria bacterium]|nr:MAG: mechanosensitive ion channel family protein [Alphaproteobacteria bacterium]